MKFKFILGRTLIQEHLLYYQVFKQKKLNDTQLGSLIQEMWLLSLAELDVLISLSIASDYYEGPTCRPNIKSVPSEDDVPVLHAENLGHPVLKSDSLDKGTFVSNNVSLGGPPNASFILLTGPNMGGKSTLLRQVCMAVILAQVSYIQ